MIAEPRIYDWSEPSYDVAFRDSTRVEWFTLRALGLSIAETDRHVLDGASRLATLWAPEPWTLTVGSFTEGIPDGECSERLELPELKLDVEGIIDIGPTLAGRLRIAVPGAAELDDEWVLADDDGVFPLPYEVSEAEPIGDLRTVWLRVPEARASSDLSVFVERAGHASARLTLGATMFAPERDSRPPDALIFGAPLADWHAANGELLRRVASSMGEAGWQPGRDQ